MKRRLLAPPAFGLKGNADRGAFLQGSTSLHNQNLACYNLKYPILLAVFDLSSIGR